MATERGGYAACPKKFAFGDRCVRGTVIVDKKVQLFLEILHIDKELLIW